MLQTAVNLLVGVGMVCVCASFARGQDVFPECRQFDT